MTTSLDHPLPALPSQPEGVAWPTDEWPTGPVPSGVDLAPLLDEVMDPEGPLVRTRAVVVVHRGRLVAERYGDRTDAWGEVTGEPVTAETPLISWSMAKSMLHAVVGMLVGEGRLVLDAPAPVPEWTSGDPRSAITLEHLLTIRDGLDFVEDYDDAGVSHVIDMLFGDGVSDTAAFAASRPLAHEPGTTFNYSSGTTNIISGIVRRELGGEDAYRTFLTDRLFAPIGMRSADPRFDDAGTWIASSYVWATARDMARFGQLSLRDGVWDGTRLLPEGWVDHGRRARSLDPEDGRLYGAQWWVVGDDLGTFWANGYEGQSILVCPTLDLVVVRLGKSVADQYPALYDWRRRVVGRVPLVRLEGPASGQGRRTRPSASRQPAGGVVASGPPGGHRPSVFDVVDGPWCVGSTTPGSWVSVQAPRTASATATAPTAARPRTVRPARPAGPPPHRRGRRWWPRRSPTSARRRGSCRRSGPPAPGHRRRSASWRRTHPRHATGRIPPS